MIPAVAIVGKSKSGKTGLMVGLISEFKRRGLRVAAVKHAHNTVELDSEGKDTWRFMQAGSDAAAVSSPGRLTVFRSTQHEPTVEEALEALGNSYDLALLEGFKKFRVPRIEVYHRNGEVLCCPPETLLAIVTAEKLPYPLPQFRPEDTQAIADFIESEVINKNCPDMSIFVNGRQVFVKSFVKDIMGRSIVGMLRALKNVGIIKTVNISLRSGKGEPLISGEE